MPYSHALAGDLALGVHKLAGLANGATLDISDVWWSALLRWIPRGPWPGLLVLYAPQGQVLWESSALLRIPGPTDDRIFCVLGNGGHFDPVWWPTLTELRAVPLGNITLGSSIIPTLTPNVGPAAGALLIWGAEYLGRIPFAGPDAREFTQDHAASVLAGMEPWQPWVQRWNSSQNRRSDLPACLKAVLLKCAEPCPPYLDLRSNVQGFHMLAQSTRLSGAQTPDDLGNLIAIAFDNLGCHLGMFPPSNTREALTWLHNPLVSLVPVGHQGH